MLGDEIQILGRKRVDSSHFLHRENRLARDVGIAERDTVANSNRRLINEVEARNGPERPSTVRMLLAMLSAFSRS